MLGRSRRKAGCAKLGQGHGLKQHDSITRPASFVQLNGFNFGASAVLLTGMSEKPMQMYLFQQDSRNEHPG